MVRSSAPASREAFLTERVMRITLLYRVLHNRVYPTELFRKMQTNIHTLVVLDVDIDWFHQMQGNAVSSLHALEIGPDDVVGLFGGHALREFAGVIGGEFPPCLLCFIGGAANLDRDAVDGATVRAPDRAEDERVGIVRLEFFLG